MCKNSQYGAIGQDLGPLLRALEAAYPDAQRRVLALLEWYGHGAGPWSGYPIYEGVPEALLLTMPVELLVQTAESRNLTLPQTEGTARLFGGWEFSKTKPGQPDCRRGCASAFS